MLVLLLSNAILFDNASVGEQVVLKRTLNTATRVESSQASVINIETIAVDGTGTSVAQVPKSVGR